MRIRHGGLSLDVPKHWSDQSTLLFVGIPETPAVPTLNAIEEPPEAVAVTMMEEAGDNPRTLLQEEAEDLEAGDPGFVLHEDGPLTAELGEGWHQVRTVTAAGVPVGQVVAAFALGPVMVCATGSAILEVFEKKKAGLLDVIRSLKLES